MGRFIAAVLCCAILTGCSLVPRGAGLQSEVLSARAEADDQGRPEFAIEVVTRDNLAVFADWPTINTQHLGWISRVDQPNNRIIAPGDTLAITIWSTEDNGLLIAPGERSVTLPEQRVSSSGRVFLPYVGEQRVSGMSPERARAVIEEEYLDVSPSVQVLLNLSEGRARAVSVVSGVNSPGSYTLADNDVTILQVLSDAGGIDASLTNPQVRLQRGGDLYGVSADRLLNRPSLNTTLRGGDTIFVEADDRSFLSLGAAGTEAIHPFPQDWVTALEALSIIGGVAETRADAQGILILRRYPAETVTQGRDGPDHPRTVFTLDLTTADGLFSADQFEIQPGDLVYVSESPLTAAGSIFAALGSVLGLAARIN
ncbi:polysaccharide biosynthesis/export family protein [Pseudooctadecabacter jejudonensis]|uniref:Polysialic acid transport protein KpsD n=1 Tax=Pseudooctadecabacter jejudonensis TaxID=1391910 RepID=A0A1Y5TH56_9RHOB|nr:polysaccharide biosynthesis/export family protein [Pseudooctadecabacter jejudonensis]SLN61945.1 Polysialic acid transport protein KpsD precursor [Pseudooctadecabacter jejudonensis]